MKKIELITIPNCIACSIVSNILKEIKTDIKLNIIGCKQDYANKYYNTNVFPTVIFKDDDREIARIFGSMPIDFYKSVINKFEEL